MFVNRARGYCTFLRNYPTQDATGGQVDDWRAFASRRAFEPVKMGGKEAFGSQQWHAEATRAIKLRYSRDLADLSVLDRVVIDGTVYDVVAPPIDFLDLGTYLDVQLRARL